MASAGSGLSELQQFCKMLKDAGHDLDKCLDRMGATPLHTATALGNMAIVKALVETGSDVNIQDSVFRTPLSRACYGGHAEVVSYLLSNGATLHQILHPVLHTAASEGHVNVVKLLLQVGADARELTNGRTAVESCLTRGLEEVDDECRVEILKALEGKWPNVFNVAPVDGPLICSAASSNMCKCIKLLVSKGLDPNSKTDGGETPLHRACYYSSACLDAVKVLVALGANLEAVDAHGRTPLSIFCATYSGDSDDDDDSAEFDDNSAEFINAMITLGANITTEDNKKFTPLHFAAAGGHMNSVYLLVENGADVNAWSSDGTSPLMACLFPEKFSDNCSDHWIPYNTRMGRARVARFLIEMGAEVPLIPEGADVTVFNAIRDALKLQKQHNDRYKDHLNTLRQSGGDGLTVRLVGEAGKETVHHINTTLAQRIMHRGETEQVIGSYSTSSAPNNVVLQLLQPKAHGFKGGIVSADGKEVKLMCDGDFTPAGFAAVVEYLGTEGVEDTIVPGKRKRSDENDGDAGEGGGGGASARCNTVKGQRVSFDKEAARQALQAAEFFCLDSMAQEVRRLMDVFGFTYEEAKAGAAGEGSCL